MVQLDFNSTCPCTCQRGAARAYQCGPDVIPQDFLQGSFLLLDEKVFSMPIAKTRQVSCGCATGGAGAARFLFLFFPRDPAAGAVRLDVSPESPAGVCNARSNALQPYVLPHNNAHSCSVFAELTSKNIASAGATPPTQDQSAQHTSEQQTMGKFWYFWYFTKVC